MTEKTTDFISNKNPNYSKQFNRSDNFKKLSEEEVVKCIKTVMDPEIPVNLYDLGLIYKIEIDENNNINVDMTLTNPNCPVAENMPKSVGEAIENLENINSLHINLVWEPKWNPDRMSVDAKLALDIH